MLNRARRISRACGESGLSAATARSTYRSKSSTGQSARQRGVPAFVSGDFARLAHSAGDFIHEPYRLPAIPGGGSAIRSGIAAGAWTGWLSGSGSSVLCVCERSKAEAVYRAMTSAFAAASMTSEGRILGADNEGLTVTG